MKDYVLDANAVIRYFEGESGDGREKVQSLFEQSRHGNARLFMSVVNMGEVLYIFLKRIGQQRAMHYIQQLQHAVSFIGVDTAQTIHAATLKHRYNLGYADSYAAALTIETRATLVSADPSFEKLGKVLKWLKLPRHRPS